MRYAFAAFVFCWAALAFYRSWQQWQRDETEYERWKNYRTTSKP